MDLRTLPPGAAPTPSPVGQVPWGPRAVAQGLGAFIVVFFASVLTIGVVLALEDSSGEAEISTGLIVATTVLLQTGTLAVAAYFGPWRARVSFAALGFRRLPRPALARWTAVALGASLTVSVGYVWLTEALAPGLAPPDLAGDLGLGDGTSPAMLVLAYIVVGLGAPLTEEVFARGFVFAGLMARWGAWPAILVSAALFGAAHLSLGLLIPAFLSGAVFAWVYWRSGSIWPVVSAHVIQNTLAFSAMVLA